MDLNLKNIHQKINKIYLRAEKDYQALNKKQISCQLESYKNNYVKINGQYQLQKYPIPVISLQNGGDIGYNLDKIFFETAFKRDEFLNLELVSILSQHEDIEIYGGRDCHKDFYQKDDNPAKIREKVKESTENTIMVSLYFDYNKEDLLDRVINFANKKEAWQNKSNVTSEISYDAYNHLSDHYFNEVDTKPYNAYYERPATLSLLPPVKNKKVLDAGCAAGWYTDWFLRQGAEVTAIDFSPAMIKMTEKRVGSRARIIQADLNQPLDFIKDQELDLIISSLTLHYIKDWEPVMAEFNRILKKSGSLVFSVHHPFMDFTVFDRDNYFATELLTDHWQPGNKKIEVQFYRRPLNQIISPLLKAGFQIEELLEPMPTEKFKEADPVDYDKLSKKPWFLIIKARK